MKSDFSFVSPNLRWALADNITRSFMPGSTNLRKGDIIAVLKTTDGGQTGRRLRIR
jgi:hypothetical protein